MCTSPYSSVSLAEWGTLRVKYAHLNIAKVEKHIAHLPSYNSEMGAVSLKMKIYFQQNFCVCVRVPCIVAHYDSSDNYKEAMKI